MHILSLNDNPSALLVMYNDFPDLSMIEDANLSVVANALAKQIDKYLDGDSGTKNTISKNNKKDA